MTDDELTRRVRKAKSLHTLLDEMQRLLDQAREVDPGAVDMTLQISGNIDPFDVAIILPGHYDVKRVRAESVVGHPRKRNVKTVRVKRGRVDRWCREMNRALTAEVSAIERLTGAPV